MTQKKKQEGRSHPWRDNIEAVTMAIVMAVLLKYFIVEAYKIPTGSMQPTLMGNDDTGIYDRILVDKFSYHYRDPDRFEVAVFKYPLDRSKNFIKRICGMPGEELKIANGDLLTRQAESEPWRILRRPRSVQGETWKRIGTEEGWKLESAGWSLEEDVLRAPGEGSARFPRSGASVMDNYDDGYPPQVAAKFHRRGASSGQHPVGDLRVELRAEAQEDCEAVELVLREGNRRYTMRFPGPAAPDDARPSIRVEDPLGTTTAGVQGAEPWRLEAGDRLPIAAQNIDDVLELDIDGEPVLELSIPAATDQRSAVVVSTVGGGAVLSDVEVFRDIYYTTETAIRSEWKIPEGHYVMLGDNTQDSEDSRAWQLAGFRVVSGDNAGAVLRGNSRNQENPRFVTGRPRGTEVFFADTFGERHEFLRAEVERLSPEPAPLVARELITGRALLVFWPLVPSLGVYRLKWIH